jgi:hypothetical protein
MSKPTEQQLQNLAQIFSDKVRSETEFQGCKIIVEEWVGEYDYEILIQDPVRFQWHTWHTDEGFATVDEARQAAESWIDNYNGPGDDYYTQ